MRTVIVGGVAGGMSAATRLRRLDEHHEIIVIERSHHVSYANCGLPYHLGGVIGDRDALLLQSPEGLHERFALDVRTDTEVLAIDRARQVVLAKDLTTGWRYELAWDRLVLSPGAAPVMPRLPGAGRALTLRTVEDVDRIVAMLDADRPRTAVVAGGGFIGIETAENLHRRGVSVTLVELADQGLAPLDPELAALVHAELATHGVGLALRAGLSRVLPRSVELTDGRSLPADLVILAIGVQPDTALARDAGLAIGPAGGIAVDHSLRTSDPRIYAIGDAAEKTDCLSAEPVLVTLANLANRQGRMVADDIAGRSRPFGPVQGTAIVKVFTQTVAVTGWSEKRLLTAQRPYLAIHTHPADHAGYYPGGEKMVLKLLADPVTHVILGAQAVGGAGTDKRIDVIATAMRGGLTAPDLADLELAYAPPYGSAKDPVNMLGYIADHRLHDRERSVQWHELAAREAAGAVLVDVRTPAEHADGHIPGSRNLPLDELRERCHELPQAEIIAYCQAGQRAHTATALLNAHGFTAANLDGGYLTWSAASRRTGHGPHPIPQLPPAIVPVPVGAAHARK